MFGKKPRMTKKKEYNLDEIGRVEEQKKSELMVLKDLIYRANIFKDGFKHPYTKEEVEQFLEEVKSVVDEHKGR